MSRFSTYCCVVIFALTAVALVIGNPGCSTPAPHTVAQPPAPPPPPPPVTCSDGSPVGTLMDVGCAAGQVGAHKTVCVDTGEWIDAVNTCAAPPPPACGKATFADVLPIFTDHCAGCHATITTYATAQAWSANISRRVALPDGDNDHMPQQSPGKPTNSLSADQIGLLQKWVSDGAIPDCSQSQQPQFIDLNYQDTAAVNDATSQSAADRPFIRYLFMGHAINSGLTGAALDTWVQAANKALNGINEASQNSFKIQSVEPTGAVWRFDIRTFGLGVNDIRAVEQGDVNLNIADLTSKGQVLGALLQTAKPWYHLDNWLDITYRNSAVYYQLLHIPATLAQLQAMIGVNVQGDLANLQNINLLGSTSSPIAENKNRLLLRDVQARDNNAYYWQTFDVNGVPHLIDADVNGQRVREDTKNLVQFPLPYGSGAAVSQAAVEVFTQDASEVIYTLPNGHQAYALFDGVGNRLNFADPNVVRDTETPVGNGTINNANSCTRCHNQGTIPMADQILATVKSHGLGNANDVQLAIKLYGAAGAAPALFRKDTALFAQALAKIGVDPSKPDPQNVVTDRFLENYDINKLSALLFLTPDQFTSALASSQIAQGQLANVLSPGGTVTFTQLVGALPQLIKDARLFQDVLGQ